MCRIMGYGVLASSRRVPLFKDKLNKAAVTTFACVVASPHHSHRLRSMLGPAKLGLLLLLWPPLASLAQAKIASADISRGPSVTATPSLRVRHELFNGKDTRGRIRLVYYLEIYTQHARRKYLRQHSCIDGERTCRKH